MNVIAVASRRKEITYMKTFTIDGDNNITVHASRKAARETGIPAFANEADLAELIGTDNKRLVEIWNSLPGVKPVAKFANRKVAAERIWKAIQSLGETTAAPVQAEEPTSAIPEPVVEVVVEPVAPPAETAIAEPVPTETVPVEVIATVDAQVAPVAPAPAKATKKAAPAKKAPKAKAGVKAMTSDGPREGSKTALVVEMLKRKDGATLEEIMKKMGWQKHTVRGFMAGAMKKAGYTIESFKPEGGERTYRINV
jgi:hypothetical protein